MSARRSPGGKAAYVLAQGQERAHGCHWPGCTRQVPPARWGCKPHWFALPKPLRDAIWAAYRPGQEKDFAVSPAYVAAARAAQDWIAAELKRRVESDLFGGSDDGRA
ncbi:MAG: hypothetical protein K2V38_18750 [Gemmataceae bacterium]|nr:hypothetical protein [Gemmataceae bacterium]